MGLAREGVIRELSTAEPASCRRRRGYDSARMSIVATILLALMGARFGLTGLVLGLVIGQMIDRSGWPRRVLHGVERVLKIGGPRVVRPAASEARSAFDPYQVLG